MSLIEFIGFIISFAALVFLFFKQRWEESRRRKNPEQYDEIKRRREEALQNILNGKPIDSLDKPSRSKPKPPSIPKQKQLKKENKNENKRENSFKFKSNLEDHRSASNIEQRHFRYSADAYSDSKIVSHQFRTEYIANAAYRIKRPSKGQLILRNLKSKKEMFIIKEIFDKPKSLRDE
jgi:hypothetical protein